MYNTYEKAFKELDIDVKRGEQKIWLLRTDGGMYYTDFKTNSYVALGWNKLSIDFLYNKNMDRKTKRDKIKQIYPNENRPGLILGQLETFYEVMQNGDLIIIPTNKSRLLLVGVLGSITTSVEHQPLDDIYEKCEFIHKRNVEWIKEIDPINDVYLSKVLKSHQTITNVTTYGDFVYRNIFPMYLDNNSIHITLRKTSMSDIELFPYIQMQSEIFTLLSKMSALYGVKDFNEQVKMKTALGSPGFCELIIPIGSASACCVAFCKLLSYFLGKTTDKDGITVTGISSIIAQINNLFNDKINRKLTAAEIRNKDAQTEKIKAETRLINSQAEKNEIDNYQIKLKNSSIEMPSADMINKALPELQLTGNKLRKEALINDMNISA